MTRRRKIGVALVLALVAALATLGVLSRHGWRAQLPGRSRPAPTARVPRANLPYLPGPVGARVPWLFEPGLAARRIAGVVRTGDAPVAGARVEARPWALRDDADGDPLALATTDAAGRFDLGELPAGTWVVAASKDGLVPGATRVHSQDPGADPPPDQLAIQLGACARQVRGRVADAQGHAIAGAQLRSVVGLYDAGVLLATTGNDGRFDVCLGAFDEAASSELIAWARGYERVATRFRDVPAHDLDVRLFTAAAVEGVVVDTEGKPVEGALVDAESTFMAFAASASAISGADGSFRIDNLGPGRVLISAQHPEHGESEGTSVQLAAGTTTPGVTIELTSRCRRLSGTVRLGGKPVAGALLLGTFTQPDGSFVARCQSTSAIELHADGYLVAAPASIPPGQTAIDDLAVELTHGAAVYGRVSAGGQPVGGASIEPSGSDMMAVRMRRGGGGVVSGRSDADGRYRISGLPPGVIELQASAEDRRRSPLVSIEITGTGEFQVDFELTASALITGVVQDADGRPLGNVVVQAEGSETDDPRTFARGRFRTSARADGSFELRALDAGRYLVRVAKLEPAAGSWPSVDVAAAGHAEVTLRVDQHAGRVIAGTVRFSDRSPASGARIRTEGATVTTVQDDGSFRIEDLVADAYTLRVLSGDGATTEVKDVRTGDEHVEIILQRPGSIEGTIAGNGDDWEVNVRKSDGRGGRGSWSSDVRGAHFLASGLSPGSYAIRVTGPGGEGSASADVREGTTTPVTVSIGASGTVSGRARVFPGGGAAAGLECRAGSDARGASGVDGAFSLPGAPPGMVRVRCSSGNVGPSVRAGSAEVTLAAGGSASVDVWVVDIDVQRIMSEGQQADLGADLRPAAGGNVALAGVVPGGPAAQAGLHDGDVVVSVDGADASGARSAPVDDYISARVPGTKLQMNVRRAGSDIAATVTLGTKEY